MTKSKPLRQMPPGDVCPAIVRLSLPVLSFCFRSMVPDTSKTMVLGPLFDRAQRSEPVTTDSSAALSSSVVT